MGPRLVTTQDHLDNPEHQAHRERLVPQEAQEDLEDLEDQEDQADPMAQMDLPLAVITQGNPAIQDHPALQEQQEAQVYQYVLMYFHFKPNTSIPIQNMTQ